MRLLPLLFVLLLSCKPSGQGPPAAASLLRVDTEAAGPNCVTGGVSIRAGLDTDHNGSLSLAEVQSIHYVCNGAPGVSAALMKEVAEDAVVRALHDVAIRRDKNGSLKWNESDAATEVVEQDGDTYEELLQRAQEALVRADIDEVSSLALRAHSIKKGPESALLLAIAACHKRDLARVVGLKPLLDPQSFRKLKQACKSVGFPIQKRSINPCSKNPNLPECMLK